MLPSCFTKRLGAESCYNTCPVREECYDMSEHIIYAPTYTDCGSKDLRFNSDGLLVCSKCHKQMEPNFEDKLKKVLTKGQYEEWFKNAHDS